MQQQITQSGSFVYLFSLLQELEDLSILAQTPALEVLALACNNVRSLK